MLFANPFLGSGTPQGAAPLNCGTVARHSREGGMDKFTQAAETIRQPV